MYNPDMKGALGMKRLVGALFVLTVVCSVCFAQEAAVKMSAPAVAAAQKVDNTKVIKGKIDSVSLADPAKGLKSTIVVVSENNQKVTILVIPTTVVYDADWKAINLDKIAKDQNVKIKYSVNNDGANEALSINLAKE